MGRIAAPNPWKSCVSASMATSEQTFQRTRRQGQLQELVEQKEDQRGQDQPDQQVCGQRPASEGSRGE